MKTVIVKGAPWPFCLTEFGYQCKPGIEITSSEREKPPTPIDPIEEALMSGEQTIETLTRVCNRTPGAIRVYISGLRRRNMIGPVNAATRRGNEAMVYRWIAA